MNAGRELDALVAEKVMGFHAHRLEWDAKCDGERCVRCGQVFSNYTEPIGRLCNGATIPYYSTEIAAAWLVLGKMAPLVGDFAGGDGWLTLTYAESADHGCGLPICAGDEHHQKEWSAHIHVESPGERCPAHWRSGDRFCAIAVTAPHAICLAALKALADAPDPR